jgi:hypothetical protein
MGDIAANPAKVPKRPSRKLAKLDVELTNDMFVFMNDRYYTAPGKYKTTKDATQPYSARTSSSLCWGCSRPAWWCGWWPERLLIGAVRGQPPAWRHAGAPTNVRQGDTHDRAHRWFPGDAVYRRVRRPCGHLGTEALRADTAPPPDRRAV